MDVQAHLSLAPRDLLILSVLAEGPSHGYGLIKAVERRSRGCLASVAGNTGSDGSEHGRIAGTWPYDTKGKFIDVTVEAFAKMPKRDVKQLSRFAERVAEYFALGLRSFELR